jgi:histidinol-phosphate aminotransferase
MSRFLTPTLTALKPYTPGEQPQDQQYIKLNTNESPYPPSPQVVAAVNAAEVEQLRLYSDPTCAQLLRTVAARYGLKPTQVMAGNGSDENLFFALRAFCDASHPLAYADVTYGCYAVWCDLMHIPSHILPLEKDFSLDPKKYYGLNETIVIANPNAPTGLALSPAEIEGILQANPNSVVIVDEAYVDFGAESCVPLIDRYENLLVVQTYSKSRQLAGARLGLAMGNEALIADLNRVKFSLNPYNINRLTLVAGRAAMEDVAYFDATRKKIMDTRAWTAEQLRSLGFVLTDSRTNFLFARTDRMEGGALYRALKAKGILVRHFDSPRISDYLRITIGTAEQMAAFIDTLKQIFAEQGV